MEGFQHEKYLGGGKFGSVSLYTDRSTGNKVVIKTLSKGVGSKQLNSFKREVGAMRLLNHPNIIRCINSFDDNENSYIVLEYVDGGNLEKLLENGAVDELVGVRILYQLLLALNEIHKKKIVHKDVKPENILFDSEGNVKLADFGIAKILGYEGDMGNTMAYSKDYGAPELFSEGKYDTKYDIFSAGVLAYRMFVGYLPFDKPEEIKSGQFKPFPNTLDPFLKEAIARMLASNPRKRPTAEKILSVMKKEFGEIKKGMDWKLNGKKLIVFGLGPIPDCSNKAPWEEEKHSIQSITVKKGVKEIGDFAFCKLPKLTAVELHSDLKIIGGGAFMNCTQLKTVTIPDSVTQIGAAAFEDCILLKSIVLPRNLTKIHARTFAQCVKLQTINLGNIATVADDAFVGCNIPINVSTEGNCDLHFLCVLGRRYMKEQNAEKALQLFKKASDGGEPEGSFEIGKCYLQGQGLEQNKEEGIRLLRMASENGFTEASYLLGMELASTNADDALSYLKLAANRGHASAACKTAQIYEEGLGVKQDLTEAVGYYRIGSEQGDIDSMCALERCFSRGAQHGEDERQRLSVSLYEQIASKFGKDLWEQEGELEWLFDGEAKRLIIKGGGSFEDHVNNSMRHEMKDYDLFEAKAPWIVRYREDICSVVICFGISSIGQCAFADCLNLTSVFLPESILSINDRAFYQSTKLAAICIPDSVRKIGEGGFFRCEALQAVKIPSGITTINSKVFCGCESIKELEIPSGVTSIGDNAFDGCIGLTSLNIPGSVTSIGSNAFDGCIGLVSINIPGGLTSIGENAFFGCEKLKSIVLQDHLEVIGSGAFKRCLRLKSLTLPETIPSFGQQVFNGCLSIAEVTVPTNLTSVHKKMFNACEKLRFIAIPETVVSLCQSAFCGCKRLEEISIPSSVISIGDCAFRDCERLKTIAIPDSTTEIGERVFSGCKKLSGVVLSNSLTVISEKLFFGCDALSSVVIPGNVTSICKCAFYGCRGLGEIVLPNTTKSIDDYAFYGCEGLTSISIPESVTTIGRRAFSECIKLKTINIPNGVTTIGKRSFSGCRRLTSMAISSSVASIGNSSFYGCTQLEKIEVDVDNQHYQTSRGVLFNKGETQLIWCSNSMRGSYSIPGSVTSIKKHAFEKCKVESVIVPSSVEIIGPSAFCGCRNLISISIPKSVTSIGTHAFFGCDKLASVNIPQNLSLQDEVFPPTTNVSTYRP